MANGSTPLAKFEQDGRASILNYQIPDATSYQGQGYIDLSIDAAWFSDGEGAGLTFPDWVRERYDVDLPDTAEIERSSDVRRRAERVREAVRQHEAIKRVRDQLESRLQQEADAGVPGLPSLNPGDPQERAVGELADTYRRDGAAPVSMPLSLRLSAVGAMTGASAVDDVMRADAERDDGPTLDPDTVEALQPRQLANDVVDGRLPMLYRGFSGVPRYEPIPMPATPQPRLMLVEEYRLSTYLGDYGAGRTVKTFSLLPGEDTNITIKTFRHEKTTRQESESVLESKSKSAAQSVETEIGREQWNKEEYEQSKSFTKKRNWNAKGNASVGFNIGIAKVDVGGGGGGGGSSTKKVSSNEVRKSFAKRTSNAVTESSSKASSKREVEVNESQKSTMETRFERAVERTIENINVSRTLNFVFRQLNQEFISIMHLVDVRVAYSDGTVSPDSSGLGTDGLHYREVPLWRLDELLADVIVPERRAEVKQQIKDELDNVVDYRGDSHRVWTEETAATADGEDTRYLRVALDEVQEYTDPRLDPDVEADQQPLRVPGIILDVTRNQLRTDGLIVEALLGKAEALDAYSQGLQAADVQEQQVANERARAAVERERLAQAIIRDANENQSRLYARLFADESDQVDVDVHAGGGDSETTA